MPDLSEGKYGIDWPEAFAELLPLLESELGAEKQVLLVRVLGNGKSGAIVYVADVTAASFTGQAILKLEEIDGADEIGKLEAARHSDAIESAPDFAKDHLPRLIATVRHGNKLAILSTIAGRALEFADPWFDLSFTRQINTIEHVSTALLASWNKDYTLSSGLISPQGLIKSWLDYRIDPDKGGRVHEFLLNSCGIPPDTPAIIYNGVWYPNPLAFFDQTVESPDRLQLRGVLGRSHNDFHGYNLLISKHNPASSSGKFGYFLIDLAMYQSRQFLFFDHAYFEFTTLWANRADGTAEDWEAVIAPLRLYQRDVEAELRADDRGIVDIINSVRQSVSKWINQHQPDRVASMQNQQILARVAVGLAFSHRNMSVEDRKKAFFYAAANLKDYLKFNRLKWPKKAAELFIDEASDTAVLPASQIAYSDGSAAQAVPTQQSGEFPPPTALSRAGPHNSGADTTDRSTGSIQPKRRRRAVLSIAGGISLLAIVIFGWFGWSEIDRTSELAGEETASQSSERGGFIGPRRQSVAVMPFTNLDQSTESTFSDGLTIEVINALAATRQLRVPGFASVNKFKDDPENYQAIANALDVGYITEGSVTKINDRVRIVVSLLDATTGDLVWNGVFDEDDVDLFQAQKALAFAIGDALSVKLDSTAQNLAAQRAIDPVAYDAYVRGIALLEQRGEALQGAIAALERAVELEPEFAAAWAALSMAYNVLPFYLHVVNGEEVRPEIFYRKSTEAAFTAMDLDPGLSDTQHAAGNMYQRDRQWVRAERAYRKALELDPSNHRAMQDYGGLLQTVGKPVEALELLKTAVSLDPINDLYQLMRARLLTQLMGSEAEIQQIEEIFQNAAAVREIAFRPILAARVKAHELERARELISNCQTCSELFRTRALSLMDAAGELTGPEIFEEFKDEVFLGYMFLYKYGDLDTVFQAFEYSALRSDYRLQYFTVPWGMIDIVGDMDKFRQIIMDMGLKDYWDDNGWSPMCKPMDSGFVCGRIEIGE